MSVFVLDKAGKPIMPCSEKRARKLIQSKRAKVHKMIPFTIRLLGIKQADCQLQEMHLKYDPGSKTTGIAVSVEDRKAISLMELEHRGNAISESLESRSSLRRGRRGRNTRYRPARFNNRVRSKKDGWLAPSIMHRAHSIMSWTNRLQKLTPISKIVMELVRFDTQLIENPEISGVEYQQGTLAQFEVKEYLLEKWGRSCAYCEAKNVPLETEHVVPQKPLPGNPRGTNRVSNLTLACVPCNKEKSNTPLEQWFMKSKRIKGSKEAKTARLNKILKQLKAPLKDAAAMNSTRWELLGLLMANQVKNLDLPYSSQEIKAAIKTWKTKRELVKTSTNAKGVWFKKFENYEQINTILKEFGIVVGTGGRTKFNRHQFGVPKTHALDALCVGQMDVKPKAWVRMPTLSIRSEGRGRYMQDNDSRGHAKRQVRADLKIAQMPEHKRPKGWQPMKRMKVWKNVPKAGHYELQAPSKAMLTIKPKARNAFGFVSGDMVRVTNKAKGLQNAIGKIAIRDTGSFDFKRGKEKIAMSYKYMTLVQRKDGYSYQLKKHENQ